MGASFRNIGEIKELAGCDLLTISPQLLKELDSTEGDLPRKLDPEKAKGMNIQRIKMDETTFENMHAADRMASTTLDDFLQAIDKDHRARSTKSERVTAIRRLSTLAFLGAAQAR